jgi:metal-responsive CopG/Arc/MetJ family transcriptional regulator
MSTERLNITIPSEIAEKFKRKIKPRKRSEFISQAIVKSLNDIEKQRLYDLMKEGYLARNEDDKELIADFDNTISDGLDE